MTIQARLRTAAAIDRAGQLRLIRVVAPNFVAAFETDGTVRRTAPILRKWLAGKSDAEARRIIAERNWQAYEVRNA